jgi:hypothetical protein
MGRYYFGTISGKFWFAIQSSDDPSYFKNDVSFSGPLKCFEYASCCCFVEDMKNNYCKECFSSYEEHFEQLDDDDKLNYPSDCALVYENNYIKYYFYEYELNFIINKLNIINKEMTIDINKLGFNLIKDEKDCIEYNIDNDEYLESITDEDQLNLIARWCLGKQIEKSILDKGYCEIYCEV